MFSNAAFLSLITEAGVRGDGGVVTQVHARVRAGDGGQVRGARGGHARPRPGQRGPRQGGRGQRLRPLVREVGVGQSLSSSDPLLGVKL